MTELAVRPLTAENWPALEALFGKAGASSSCWCAYWRLGPRYRDRDPEGNKRDLLLLAESGRSPGLLAFGADGSEGYPVDTDVPGHTRNAFTGTAAAFARHGFEVVARRKADRPIMRLSLT